MSPTRQLIETTFRGMVPKTHFNIALTNILNGKAVASQ